MKISYLDGPRLYYAFLAGGNEVIKDQKYLKKINVFPVPDADTGTNLASTMHSIAEGAVPNPSFSLTLNSIADAALSGAQGNSGLIFAQFYDDKSAIKHRYCTEALFVGKDMDLDKLKEESIVWSD